MKILFVHQNFPGQFRHLAPELARRGHQVTGLGSHKPDHLLAGVEHLLHQPKAGASAVAKTEPGLAELETKLVRGRAVAALLEQRKADGQVPDVVFSHPGWGEAMFLRDVFPTARLLSYAEYYYGGDTGDLAFDPEFSRPTPEARQRARLKNTHLLHALSVSDANLSPTEFQRDQHPAWAWPRISVVHDGIDTAKFAPNPKASVHLQRQGVALTVGQETVTFVARQLEPYRGYHIFMRALPILQKLRPHARVVIVGGDQVSYGAAPTNGKTWRQTFLDEVAAGLDMGRVHYVGRLPHAVLTQLMQVSAAHVYLTYPFVLSWSLLEAMSIGCLIVGSRTAPVEEVIQHGHNGLLTDFFDPQALAETIAHALEHRAQMAPLREAARRTVVERFDLQGHCLPKLVDFTLGG
ncbi:glycosyltransferase [Ideonella sp. A 288]|uniref:glycosyltransferase n=1 Tax=Ideonella sp. A 288 TaxID=1962181 RepID=UPI000B4A7FF1|nr:glycosyltransferase [Ideonella sp. A 288]